MSQLPSGWPRRPEDAAYFPEGWLKGKGWPTFERAVSAQIKPASGESWRRIVDPDGERFGFVAYRDPPVHPRAFAARLARTVFANGKSDCELVAGLYADTLAGGFGRARELKYRNATWGDEEAVQLAEALPLALEVTLLDLAANSDIGQRGLDALAAALNAGAAPKLREVWGDWESNIWGEKADGLRAACEARGIIVIDSLFAAGFRHRSYQYHDGSQGYHPGVRCDMSGQYPIVGNRYKRNTNADDGDSYDLCEAEWKKLPEEEQAKYTCIKPTEFRPAQQGYQLHQAPLDAI